MAPTEEWKSSRFAVLCPLCGLMQHNFLNEKFPFATDFLRCHGNRFFWGRRKCGNSWRIFPFPLLRKKRPPSIGVGLPRLNGKLVAFFLLVFFFFWSFFLSGMVPHQTRLFLFHAKGVNAWKRRYAYFCISFFTKMLFLGVYSSLWHCKNSFVFATFPWGSCAAPITEQAK